MVYTEIAIVYGVVVDRAELVRFIQAEFVTCTEAQRGSVTIESIAKHYDGLDDEEWRFEGIDIRDEFVRTWPCCSPLNGQKFLLGYETEVDPDDIMNTICMVGIGDDVKTRTVDRLRAAGITDVPKIVLMLNDCTRCS